MNKYAIIVAGGTGTRMGRSLPKQFILLKDKPVLYYTLKTFLNRILIYKLYLYYLSNLLTWARRSLMHILIKKG